MTTLQVIPVGAASATTPTEDVVVATAGRYEGHAYTGTADGAILRVASDGDRVEQVAHTGGRPLGLELDGTDRLIVCDAQRGLLRLDLRDGGLETLLDQVDGRPLRLCNNAAVAADGTVWFTDSSAHHDLRHWMREMTENTRTGRLLRRDPDGGVEVVVDGLGFANGVVLAADESFVAVAETAGRGVVRLWLDGPRRGMRDRLCSDLPGYPDNLSLGEDGAVWVALVSPTVPALGLIHRSPRRVRQLAGRLPAALQPPRGSVVHARAYDEDGAVVAELRLDPPTGGSSFDQVTGVREHEGRLWLASFAHPALALAAR